MITKFLSFLAPVAVAAIGFGGALQHQAAGQAESAQSSVWGYKHVSSPVNCERVQLCDNSGNFVCTSSIDGSTLYQLTSENPNSCPTILMRTTP